MKGRIWEYFLISESWTGFAKDWKDQVSKIESDGWTISSIRRSDRTYNIQIFAWREKP